MSRTAPTRRTKAFRALAASALAVGLLTGVGGTFANWYDSAGVGAASIQAGHLDWNIGTPAWRDAKNNVAIDAATFKMVPGDKLEYTTTITTDAAGTNLKARLSASVANATGTMAPHVAVSTLVNGAAGAFSVPQGTATVPVTVTVEMPFTTADSNGTDGQATTLDLASMTLDLEQIA